MDMKRIFIFLCSVCLSFSLLSQSGREWIPVWERSVLDSVMNLTYTHNEGYTGDSSWFRLGDSPIAVIFGTGGVNTRLLSADERFLVFLRILQPYIYEDSINQNLNSKTKYDFIDREHIILSKDIVKSFLGEDKVNEWQKYVHYYSPKEAKEKFNADTALYISLPHLKEGTYVSHYSYCTVVIIQKTGRGHVSMFCFYDDESKKDLKQHLSAVENMFRYEDRLPLKTKLCQPEIVTFVANPKQKKAEKLK
jgi:hypothetical protein